MMASVSSTTPGFPTGSSERSMLRELSWASQSTLSVKANAQVCWVIRQFLVGPTSLKDLFASSSAPEFSLSIRELVSLAATSFLLHRACVAKAKALASGKITRELVISACYAGSLPVMDSLFGLDTLEPLGHALNKSTGQELLRAICTSGRPEALEWLLARFELLSILPTIYKI